MAPAAVTKALWGTCKAFEYAQTEDFNELTNGALISFCMVNKAASWHSALISAPLHPAVWMKHYVLLV